MNIYKKVLHGVKWNAFESIIYQILLCIHRFALYKILGPIEFGMLGCIFTSIYGLIFLTNLGFNDSINVFFLDISQSKHSFRKFFIQHVIPHIGFIALFPIALWFLPFHALSLLSDNMFFIAGALFIAESLRITLRTLLQLVFINKQLACIDLSGLCLYLVIIWSLWLYGFSLTFYIVFIPLTIISYIQVLILSIYTILWYMMLPINNFFLPPYKRVMRIRLLSYMHHIISSHFISNFIVPYSAYIWGLEYASMTKLIVSVSHLISTVIKHTIGFSCVTLFSHFKHASTAEKSSIFKLINKFLYVSICIIILLCCTFYTILGHYVKNINIHLGLISFLFVLIFENCFIPCESAYLNEECPETLIITYIMSIMTTYILFYYHATNHVYLLIPSFFIIRLLNLGLLTFILTNKWKNPTL